MSDEIKIREAKLGDIDKLVYLLNQLSPFEGDIDKNKVEKILEYNINSDNHHLFVAELGNEVAGTGLLLLQMNLSYNGSVSGHIENIVVDKNHRKKGVGKKIVEFLIEKAKEMNCRKVILNCKKENIPFYEKCNLSETGEVEMRVNL